MIRYLFIEKKTVILAVFLFVCCIQAVNAVSTPSKNSIPLTSISSNPAAVNMATGSGALQQYIEKRLGIQDDHGIAFSGAWIGDINQLFSGGVPHPVRTTSNSLLFVDMAVDTEKMHAWKGGLFTIELLQLNASTTNRQAGSTQGYNAIPGPAPLNRFELYQLWYRQAFFDEKFFLRIGKTVPSDDFDNIIKPVALSAGSPTIPAVTGLLYTPIFINTSMLDVMPGYYNSSYGVTLNFTPIKQWYLSYGIYDGNLARNEQIGLHATPTFNGAYFQIAETGAAWLLGQQVMPGNVGVGLWHQHGTIQGPPSVTEKNAVGYYIFGSQRVWYRHPGVDNSGISGFYQYGTNNSQAMPFQKFVGAGLTAFGLVPNRADDSMGLGAAFSWLNPNSFNHSNELILQAYYQATVIKDVYLEPAFSYIPSPGTNGSHNNATAGTLRVIIVF